LAFLSVGLFSLLQGRALLTLPSDSAGGVILAVEVAATISITAALASVFLGGHPAAWYARANRGGDA